MNTVVQMKTPMSKDTGLKELITPDLARKILSTNINNRNLNSGTVSYYMDQIRRGNWLMNGETIKISWAVDGYPDGILLDGQHRLEAISRTGIAVETYIVRGLDPACFTTIDAGKIRSHADYLKIAGHGGNLQTLAAAARIAMSFDAEGVYGTVSTKKLSPEDVVCYVDKHPGLEESCTIIMQKIGRIMPASIAIGCHYLFSLIDPDRATEFFQYLTVGEGLKEGNPILTLRNRLISLRGDHRAGTSHRRMLCYYLVHTWNAYTSGRDFKNLPYKSEFEIRVEGFKDSVLSNWR